MLNTTYFKSCLIGIILLITNLAPCYSASFKCDSHLSEAETLVCTDRELSEKDSNMAVVYKKLLKRGFYGESKNAFKTEQLAWIKTRNACKSSVCLNDIYDERIQILAEYMKQPFEVKVLPPVCSKTFISEISARLPSEDPQTRGTRISYANGLGGVSYDYVASIWERSRIKDPVRVCLIAKYLNCPKGDDRGKTFEGTNLRTGEKWKLGDSQHICSGA